MSTIQVTSPIDGVVVTYNPMGDWVQMSINEVYFGREGLNKRVPKVLDWVVNPVTAQRFICESIDETTLVPVLRDITSSNDGSLTDAQGSQPDTYRASFDATSIPYRLNVDPRFFIYGSDASYARIYRGTDTLDSSKIISVMYDNMGNFLTNNVPLIDVARNNITGIIQKAVAPCNTNTELQTGEMITIVYFTDQGRIYGEDPLRVIRTTWVAPQEADSKYITHISLQSPYLSATDPTLLEVPINVQLNALNMFGVLHYSNGSMSDPMPIDGTKFELLGIDQFLGVYPSQQARLTLIYKLGPNEPVNGPTTIDGTKVVAPYRLITTPQNGAFTVKLAGYPAWNTTEQAYRMHWFLTDLNRDTMLNVTPYIYYNESSDVFDGTKFNQIQNLSVRINMREISSSYPSVIHTQTERVTLDMAGDRPGPNWRIAFDINQTPLFGTTLVAQAVMINQNLWRVNVRFGAPNFQEWLDRIYYDSRPIFDPRTESKAPAPTHMVIFKDAVRTEVPIEQWAGEFQVSVNFATSNNIQIEFIRKEGNNRLTLGVIAMPVKK